MRDERCRGCHELERRVDYHWNCVNCDGKNFTPKRGAEEPRPRDNPQR